MSTASQLQQRTIDTSDKKKWLNANQAAKLLGITRPGWVYRAKLLGIARMSGLYDRDDVLRTRTIDARAVGKVQRQPPPDEATDHSNAKVDAQITEAQTPASVEVVKTDDSPQPDSTAQIDQSPPTHGATQINSESGETKAKVDTESEIDAAKVEQSLTNVKQPQQWVISPLNGAMMRPGRIPNSVSLKEWLDKCGGMGRAELEKIIEHNPEKGSKAVAAFLWWVARGHGAKSSPIQIKQAMDAIRDLSDRLLGKPKQEVHIEIDANIQTRSLELVALFTPGVQYDGADIIQMLVGIVGRAE